MILTLVAIEIGAMKVIPNPSPNRVLKVIANSKNECLIVIDDSKNEALFETGFFLKIKTKLIIANII